MIRNLLLAMLASFLSPGVAYAEPEPGTRIDQNRGSVGAIESEDARTANRVMNTFGRCVARNRAHGAEAILALPLVSPEQDRLSRRQIGGEDGCLGMGNRELRFRPLLLVGAMAEWFVIDRYGNRDLADIAAMTDEQQAELGLAPRTGYEDVALCIVRRNPDAVMALIRTQPSSEAERIAISHLTPDLGPCLPAGQTFNFNYPSLRAIVAAGIYRVLSAMGGAASPGPRS